MTSFAMVDADIFTGDDVVKAAMRGDLNQADVDRFMAKVRRDGDGCWIWTGAVSRDTGYGRFKFEKFSWLAHRWSYMAHFGDIPEGLYLDHLCRNRSCVNPEHLEPVTPMENSRRRVFGETREFCRVCGHALGDAS